VWLQLKGKLTDRMLVTGKYVKGFFYLVLFGAAAYWGVNGDFLDFWDALLWLVAFIFIEMNVFQRHGESSVPRISPPAPDGDRESRALPVR
jgi:hypothetical protein